MPALIEFELLFENEEKKYTPFEGKFQLPTTENSLTLTPEFLQQKFSNYLESDKKIIGFNAHIDCDKLILVIKDFSYFTLQKFGLSSANVSLLKVLDISDFFRINGFSVERFDIERSSNLIVNCDIQELNLGIETNYNNLRNSSPESLQETWTDIRESKINKARLFVPQTRINIQNSTCKRFVFEGSAKSIDDLHIWENTLLDTLTLSGHFKKIKIKHSTINKVLFSNNTQINDIDIDSTIIENIHNANENTFINKTIDNWSLIAESAKSSNNSSLYSMANFEYLKLERKSNPKIFQKLLNLSMELTSGYGYKPSRTVGTSLLIWVLFTGLYWLISKYTYGGLRLLNGEIISGLKGLGYSAYFSLITFTTTSFGDITPVGLWAKLTAGIQTLLGISFMSLFIFALTKRYGSFK
ncbi:potassium channel family protein [Lysinibacillus sp. NPDC097214]|uniref:potassium channel family protein n=1 Tax=Lysinibacillus sp. NPDC097214 TaxID=3390584 RepID=UPI003D00A386